MTMIAAKDGEESDVNPFPKPSESLVKNFFVGS